MTGAKYWAIVPAAGSGQRFGSEVAKQFQPLGDHLVAQHSLSRLLAIPCIATIIVPCDTTSAYWQQIPATIDTRVELVAGGSERVYSVLQGLKAIADRAASSDWVLVHDMARPCITSGDINKLIAELAGHSVGGILATSVSDTLKRVGADNDIQGTADRSLYRAAQTPQMFRYGLLVKALETMLGDGQTPTDEASAIEYLGEQAKVIQGRRDNIKITHREDLIIAAAIMNQQETEQCV
jgi:2-C-methyl-D-erythritol 4-phosphate cytidylyltransferase|tara:strand:- start:4148 stop:4861 length:714 start_codon:yes stop_codon:yes gene_type:complete